MSTTPDPVWSNRAIKWFDRRLPLFTLVYKELGVYPTPRNINYWWAFGSLSGIILVIMFCVKSLHYLPY